jgi:hypothetical protein
MSHIVRIISKSERKKHVEYELVFTCVGKDDGSGFGFPCKKDGTLIHDENYDCWIKNYNYCIAHPEEFEAEGVKEILWWYTEPTHAKCSCGYEVILDGDTYCTGCGQLYNGFGQALKDPSEWEENDYDDEW